MAAGCAAVEEEPVPDGDRVIVFSWQLPTRGSSYTPDDAAPANPLLSFGVSGYQHTGDFSTLVTTPSLFDGTVVSRANASSAWSYANPRQWPVTEDKFSFFAYAPAQNLPSGVSVSTTATSGYPTLAFTQAQDVASQVDLLVAANMNFAGNATVPMSFAHALGRIVFSAQMKNALAIDKSLTITGLKVYYAPAVKRSGTYSYQTGAWTSGTATMTDYTGTDASAKNTLPLASSLAFASTDGTTARIITASNGDLMMIPQTVAAGDVTVEVSYTCEGMPDTKTVSCPAITWAKGNNYQYNIVIDPAGDLSIAVTDITLDNFTVLRAVNPVNLSSDSQQNATLIGNSVSALNDLKGMHDNVHTFGMLGCGAVSSAVSVDFTALSTGNFKPGDALVLDFLRTVTNWKTDTDGVPYKISVSNVTAGWVVFNSLNVAHGYCTGPGQLYLIKPYGPLQSHAVAPHTLTGLKATDETAIVGMISGQSAKRTAAYLTYGFRNFGVNVLGMMSGALTVDVGSATISGFVSGDRLHVRVNLLAGWGEGSTIALTNYATAWDVEQGDPDEDTGDLVFHSRFDKEIILVKK